jgi:hypothetical protein
MSLLDLFRKSRLKINTPNGNKPTPYQDSVVEMRNVKFPSNISPGAIFEQYIRYEETGAVAGTPDPVELTYYMVAENEDFLMTENDDNLIVNQEIV